MFCLGLWQGLLLGIDAEFVALSASEKGSREDGVEFVKRPARLSLARVSVVCLLLSTLSLLSISHSRQSVLTLSMLSSE
jgi:hypothetical protein